jgi:hypothetical protein
MILVLLRLRRRSAAPIPPKPSSIIDQVAGSGTAPATRVACPPNEPFPRETPLTVIVLYTGLSIELMVIGTPVIENCSLCPQVPVPGSVQTVFIASKNVAVAAKPLINTDVISVSAVLAYTVVPVVTAPLPVPLKGLWNTNKSWNVPAGIPTWPKEAVMGEVSPEVMKYVPAGLVELLTLTVVDALAGAARARMEAAVKAVMMRYISLSSEVTLVVSDSLTYHLLSRNHKYFRVPIRDKHFVVTEILNRTTASFVP